MRMPAQFRSLVVTNEAGETFHGITYSKARGFFEPITNLSFEPVAGKVTGWRYEHAGVTPASQGSHPDD